MFQIQQISSATFAFVAVLVSSALTSSLPAQTVEPPAVEWQKTFGGRGVEIARSIQQTTDGGYIVAGTARSFRADNSDVYLVKTDANGNISPGWPKTFGGGASDDWAYSVQQTTDGGYIVAGSTNPTGADDVDVYLVKTDANGNLAPGFPKTIGGAGYNVAYSVQQTTDGGYIVAGVTDSFGAGFSDVYLVKTDANGNVAPGWPKIFGGGGIDFARSVQQTADGGYIVAGGTDSGRYNHFADFYLIKIHADGTLAPGWPKIFVSPDSSDAAYSVQQTLDGGYIAAGYTYLLGTESVYMQVIKTDANGNVTPGWPKTFGGGREQAHSVQQTTDGGYIVAGHTSWYGAGRWDVYLIKTDVAGNLVWQTTFGGASDDSGYSVQQTSDGGYIVAGQTYSFGAGGWDVYLIKLAPERPLPPTNLTVNYSISRSLVTLTWESSPSATVDRYIVERKLGCEVWQIYDDNFSASGPTVYHDGVPDGSSVCYRVSAANATDISKPTAPACLAVPSDSRYQLKLYDPDTINPDHPDAGAWVDFYPCDWRFKSDRGTAVIVHGWQRNADEDQLGEWMLETAKPISERFNGLVNVLAWEWLPEAYGSLRQAQEHIDKQAERLAAALRLTFSSGYAGPIHLMGHSMGTHVVVVCALHLLSGQPPIVVDPEHIQLTLWDTSDLADLVVGSISYLDSNVSEVRRRSVYVDSYDGITSLGTHNSNFWVNVPRGPLWPFKCASGVSGHNVDQWYRCTIPTDSQEADPVLFRYKPGSVCEIEPLPVGTIGFGTSVLLFGLANRPDSRDCPSGTFSFGLRRSCPTDFENRGEHFVLLGTENCESAPPTTLVIVSDLNTGDYWLRENWQPNFGFVNSTEMFFGAQAQGEGGGAGGQDLGEPDVRYALNLVVDPEWDYFSFDYDFTEAPAPTTLSVIITAGADVYPVFQMSSDLVLAEGYLNTGLRDIRQLQGQTVSVAFELRSEQPGMVVYLRNLTFWRDPWHGNRPPVANAGSDQQVPAGDNGFASVVLDATATTDADDDPLTYWWALEDTILATGVQPPVALCPGEHLITLVVRDPADHVSTDQVVVTVTGEPLFVRADSNNNGDVDISDAINTLGFLFTSAGSVTCQDAADANDDGTVDISDAIFTLGFLFLGTPVTIPMPYPTRGADLTTDQISCENC